MCEELRGEWSVRSDAGCTSVWQVLDYHRTLGVFSHLHSECTFTVPHAQEISNKTADIGTRVEGVVLKAP